MRHRPAPRRQPTADFDPALVTAVQNTDAFTRAGRPRRARWLAAWTVMRHDPGELARLLAALDADTPRGK